MVSDWRTIARNCTSLIMMRRVLEKNPTILSFYSGPVLMVTTIMIIMITLPVLTVIKNKVTLATGGGNFQDLDSNVGSSTPAGYIIHSITLPTSLFTTRFGWLLVQ
mgnify:CR=1 FL=1